MNRRNLAALMMIVGALALLVGCQMDTSVPSSLGGRVINLPLAAQQQTTLIVGGVLFVAGVILWSSSAPPPAPDGIGNPSADGSAQPEALVSGAGFKLAEIGKDLSSLAFRDLMILGGIGFVAFALVGILSGSSTLGLILGLPLGYYVDRKRRLGPKPPADMPRDS